MGGPSGHGQRNKSHKAGRSAGPSARQKQRMGKEAAPQRQAAKAGSSQGGKVERLSASKQHRDLKRQELLDKKRRSSAPIVVAVLPLSEGIDLQRLWQGLLNACKPSNDNEPLHQNDDGEMDIDDEDFELSASTSCSIPLMLHTAAVQSSKGGRGGVKLTLLPPPASRSDLLSIVDIGRSAEILLLIVPGSESQGDTIDREGEEALAVLRALGLPEIVLAVQSEGGVSGQDKVKGGSAVKMKERSAAKKRAEKAIASQIAGDHRLFHVDTRTDLSQLIRHISEHTPALPVWRRSRPSIMVEGARFEPSSEHSAESGTLSITGYVRSAGLSANQLIHIPGAGDYQIDRIEAAQEETGVGAGGMDISGSHIGVLAKHDPEERESLVRVNVPDPGDEEQTWPSEKELLDVEQLLKGKVRRRKLPEGTSEYQAAWILDEDEGDDVDEDEDEEEEMEGQEGQEAMEADDEDEAPDLDPSAKEDEEEEEEDGMAVDDDEDGDEGAGVQGGRAAREALRRELRDKHRREEEEKEQQDFPDEVEVPDDVAARIRFQKYRGLKSFRSSPWDSKEWLPKEYSNVFAFENFRRAHKRAKEAVERATEGLDPCSVPPGSYVTIHVSAVPAHLAASVVSRALEASTSSSRPPLVAFGLMQHEGRMSVLHAGIKKAASFDAPIANKEELMVVTGVRTFTTTPVLSADTPGDKQKMERFLHAGRYSVATVFAPISYGPLPFLAFKRQGPASSEGALKVKLAACGSVRSCDPDRVVLKKITLTGFPVRVHKRRATVKFMFYNPDDIRWFKPVELYTKYGRRGTIEEPIGTHGAMKCMFDAPVQQRDAVCMSLYKRVFPKWPQALDFSE